MATVIPSFFPKGSDQGETRALPEIWTKWSEFEAAGNAHVTESDEGDNDCSDTVTVTAPDLIVTKNNSGTPVSIGDANGGQWTWSLTVDNSGTAPADFASGVVILSDTLPSGPSWGPTSLSGQSGIGGSENILCSIDGDVLKLFQKKQLDL